MTKDQKPVTRTPTFYGKTITEVILAMLITGLIGIGLKTIISGVPFVLILAVFYVYIALPLSEYLYHKNKKEKS